MSILLDSLSQKNDSASKSIPDLHASHFDDEMLGDEWLLARVKLWRSLTFFLILLLLISWGYFLVNKTSDEMEKHSQAPENTATEELRDEAIDVEPKIILTEKKSLNKKQTNPIVDAKVVDSRLDNDRLDNKKLDSKSSTNDGSGKTLYQPKKREVVEHKKSQRTNVDNPRAGSSISNSNLVKTVPPAKKQQPAILLSELPAKFRDEFPDVELGSYVVSDKTENSFVIIDGGFYKINQVIAPEMILRDINNQHILVEFKEYLVKLPH